MQTPYLPFVPRAMWRGLRTSALLAGLSWPALAQTTGSGTAFPLGVHVSNPNGNDADKEQQFENEFTEFVATMGKVRPTYFNAFVDFRQEPSQWVGNASWTAWSCNKSGAGYFGASTGMVPVVGVPLASNSGGWGNVDAFYQDIIAGKYDDVFTGIVQVWVDQGYKKLEFRNGYEFNGTFMAWSPYNSGATDVRLHFVQAFRRVADLQHAAGKKLGVQVLVNWNPNGTNYTNGDTQELYPGDSYVDIISVDQYSPLWPQDYTNWHSNVNEQLSPAAFAADPVNRRHFWTWPGDKYWKSAYTGKEVTLGDWSWSVRMTTDFAKLHGKPIAVDETGAGPSADSKALGPSDDPEFPHWLSDELKRAQGLGVAVDHVNIWCSWEGDGDWNFLPSNTAHPKPLEAAAWAQYFGAGSGSSTTPATAGIVSGGTYKLLARHSGKALDVDGGSTANGGKVQQWTSYDNNPNQQWVITQQSNGTYTLTHKNTNQVLDVDGGSTADGGKVQQWLFYANNPNQQWVITPTDNGYYKLVHQGTSKCLDVPAASTADGVSLIQYEYKGSPNQQWQLVRLDQATARTAGATAATQAIAGTSPLSAYPNPSQGRATLSFDAAQAQAVTVYVHNAQGHLVTLLSVPAQAGHTDFALPSSLPAGTYLLRATIDGVKQHFTLRVE